MSQRIKQKPKTALFNRNTLGVLALVLVVAALALCMMKSGLTDTKKPPPKTHTVSESTPSQFSFAGTAGWQQGPTNGSSMALFKSTHECFASIEHKPGTVNMAAELQKTQDNLTKQGYSVAPGGNPTLTIQTPQGPQQYQLHQSAVTSPAGASTLEGGQEFGYLQLSSGYLYIMGYCDTAAQLPATIPALQAITFTQ